MSPLNWSFLFLYFLTLMAMMIFKIYFLESPSLNSKINKIDNNNKTMIKFQW